MPLIDLTGRKFDRLYVTGLHSIELGVAFWSCKCDCGNERRVRGGDLKRGKHRSCGCLTKERNVELNTKHGMCNHKAYRSWIYMHVRCSDPENEAHKDYAGRGISVSPRWATFDAFWEDMGPSWSPKKSLDRIDVNGNYEPGNCRWATPIEQANNRRNNRICRTPKGPMTVAQAARLYGISANAAYSRLKWDANGECFLPVAAEGPIEKQVSFVRS